MDKCSSNSKAHMDLLHILVIVVLFIFSINFMNKANYLIILLFGISLLFAMVKRNSIPNNLEFMVLSACFISYFMIYNMYFEVSPQTFITFLIGPVIGYFIGYIVWDKADIKKSRSLINTIIIGIFIHGLLNMVLLFRDGSSLRRVPDIWTGVKMSATLQGTYFTMIVSLLFYALLILKNKVYKILLLSSIIFSIYATLETATRTLIYIMIIVFFVNIVLYIYLNKRRNLRVIRLAIWLTLISLFLFIIYKNNIFGIKTIYEDSTYYARITSQNQKNTAEDPRFEMQKMVLEHMFEYPMGGDKIELEFAHNLWLDTAKKVGIIPFFLMIWYFLLTIRTLFKFIRNQNVNLENKYLILSVYSSLFLNFMVEPILEGVPYLFVVMCIVNGITRKYLDVTERYVNNENSMAM